MNRFNDLTDFSTEEINALLELATGGTPNLPVLVAERGDPFEHPDALRRFRVIEDVQELERAMDSPWDRWSVFLHPAQLDTVTRQLRGLAGKSLLLQSRPEIYKVYRKHSRHWCH